MVHLPPPPQHPSRDDDDRTAALQYQAVTKFWKSVLGIILSIGVIVTGWASHTPIILGVGILAFALSCWTMYDAVHLNQQAEYGELTQPVVDYPESPEPPQRGWVDTERVSDLQKLFSDAEHRALRADVNELPTRQHGDVAGTEGFD